MIPSLNLFHLVAKRGGTCSKVIKPRYCTTDLHYNLTFVPVEDQSDDTILQAILNSKCSADFEKYLCYTSTPLCKPNDLSVYVPCRDICEQVGYQNVMERNSDLYFFFLARYHFIQSFANLCIWPLRNGNTCAKHRCLPLRLLSQKRL